MADLKISALTASTTPLAGTEVLPIVQSSTTKQVSVANLTAGRAMSALSGSFGTGTSAYSISGTQVSATNTSANTYLSIYGGAGSTNGGFLLGGNNTENQANFFWNETGNYLQIAANPVSSKIKIYTAGVDIGDFTTNGYAPSNGKGIDFSATSGSGTSELLADYEEGTYDPTISFGTSGSITLNSNYKTFSYTKIGRLVTITGYLLIDSVSSPTGYMIVSLPFSSKAGTAFDFTGSILISGTVSLAANQFGVIGLQNNSNVWVYTTNGTSWGVPVGQQLTTNTEIRITFSYVAA